MDLVDAVERVANHMRQEWGFLITDDAIEFFRKEYDHRYADRGRDQGTLFSAACFGSGAAMRVGPTWAGE